MPYKCPEKAREAAKIRQRRCREKHKEKLRIKNLGRYHALYKKDGEYKEKANIRSKEWREANSERVKEYLDKNPEQREKARIRAKEWQKKNRGRALANSNLRKKRVRQAMPPWADRRKISDIYEKSVQMEKQTGVKHHVDHIIQLVNDKICGLHIPINLQVIPASDNLRKGNSLPN